MLGSRGLCRGARAVTWICDWVGGGMLSQFGCVCALSLASFCGNTSVEPGGITILFEFSTKILNTTTQR